MSDHAAPGSAASWMFADLGQRPACLERVCLALGTLIVMAGCSVSEDDERALGTSEAAQVDSQLPVVRDSVITQFVTTVGQSLASRTSRADLDWRFAVVNTSEANAFALPGGFIYVTRGLIEQADRFDQLAGVIGHEIGHVVRRHSVKQLEGAAKRDVGLVLLCTLTPACHTIGGRIAIRVGSDALSAQYSQLDETQADSEAVVNTVRVGIDPEGLPAFLQQLLDQQKKQPTAAEAFFSTHPTNQARISALRRQIAALGPLTERKLVQDTPEFHDFQARVHALPPPPVVQRPPDGPDAERQTP